MSVVGVSPVCNREAISVSDALATAYAARRACRELPAHARMSALRNAAANIFAKREMMACTIVAEGVKTIREARREVDRCHETLLLAAEEARRLGGECVNFGQSAASAGRIGWWERRPLGVVVGITPYNDPLNLVAHKIAPALAAGAPIIIKPHPRTPTSAHELAQAFSGSGLPDGAIQILEASNAQTIELVSDARTSFVSFTGGKQAGEAISRHAIGKRLALELGGVCVAAVGSDADVPRAAEALASGIVWAAGQNCVHTQRIFAERAVFEQLATNLTGRLQALRWDDPFSEMADYGSLISEEHADRVHAQIVDACSRGATLLVGGRRSGRRLQPTLLTGVPDHHPLAREEIFAPVAAIEVVDSLAEAENRAADNGAMINSAIFTNRLDSILSWHNALDAGATIVNDSTDFRIDAMPFGGNGSAGLGREGIRFAIEAMTEPKLICIRT
jgi:glyceraldehyde-3-phosphate dehydrogenase (NADP+)